MSSRISEEERKRIHREYTYQWNKDHPEKTAEYARKYKATHKEQCETHGKLWKKRNPEKVKEYNRKSWKKMQQDPEFREMNKKRHKKYYREHKELVKATVKKSYEKNKEKILAQQKEYNQRNREKRREWSRNYRLRKKLLLKK